MRSKHFNRSGADIPAPVLVARVESGGHVTAHCSRRDHGSPSGAGHREEFAETILTPNHFNYNHTNNNLLIFKKKVQNLCCFKKCVVFFSQKKTKTIKQIRSSPKQRGKQRLY